MRLRHTSKKVRTIISPSVTFLFIFTVVLRYLVPSVTRSHENARAAYVFDILTVGSKEDVSRLRTQRRTWASHEAVRIIDFAIHDDGDDANCVRNMSSDEVLQHLFTCRNERYWQRIGASIDPLIRSIMQVAYEPNYVMSKPDPAGWVCAQSHIAKSFIKHVGKYTSETLPDYLIIVDSDTYLNMDQLTKFLFEQPYQVPSHDEPVIWAGCKMNFGNPKENVAFTTPYGGFGTMFSQRSLMLMNQPIYCSEAVVPSEYERTICNKFIQKANFSYPMSATIGEERFFSPGDTVTEVFRKYFQAIKPFCLHSDHLYAYLAIFLSLSRLPVVGDTTRSSWGGKFELNRLHSIMGNEVYHDVGETCSNDGSCGSNAIACHKMSSDDMRRVHRLHSNAATPKKLVTSVTEQLVLPNILFAGVQKSGSTSIAKFLFSAGVCQPRIFNLEPAYYQKEVHFFDRPERYEQGLQFYSRRFEHCTHEKFVMDATPDTFRYPEHVQSTYSPVVDAQTDVVADLKIIVTLREPVARELSWYNHMVSEVSLNSTWIPFQDVPGSSSPKGFEKYATDLASSLTNSANSTIYNNGYYAHHLSKWFELFPRKNILVLSYDEVKANPTKAMWRIETFLGLQETANSDAPVLKHLNTKDSLSKVSVPSCAAQRTLADIYEAENQKLYDLLESNPGNSFEQRPFPKFTLDNCTLMKD